MKSMQIFIKAKLNTYCGRAFPTARVTRLLHVIISVCLTLICVLPMTASLATESVRGLELPIMIKAREQPVDKFIRIVFGQMGVPVNVHDGVTGIVNGDFDKPANELLDELEKVFQLTFYYDGAVVHVYPSSDLERDILYVKAPIAQRVREHAQTLALPDEQNRLETASLGLVVTGTQRFREQVRELADAAQSELRSKETPETFRVFKLRYGWAGDVSLVVGGQTLTLPGVASLLQNLIDPQDSGSPVLGVERKPAAATEPKLKGEGLQSVGNELKILPSDVQAEARDQAAALLQPSSSTGKVRIVADPLNNAIVIRDKVDRMPHYERLIKTLDVEPMMVEIEATIIDVNTDRLRQLGVSARYENNNVTALTDFAGAAGSLSEVTPVGDGGVVSLVLGDRSRFLSRIRALENEGAAQIVSKPHVITLANVEALLDSTSTFFVRVAGQEEVDLFNVSVGTALRVTPHVYEKAGGSQIKLLVSIEDGRTSDRQVDSIPVIERATINTQALIDEGQSLLIGGLMREMNEDSKSSVPLLGKIPVLGSVFRSNNKSHRQTERMFLITPRVTARSNQGNLRLDAPVLSGTEEQIIRSGPLRLKPARNALNARGLSPVFDENRVPESEDASTAEQPRAPIRMRRGLPVLQPPSQLTAKLPDIGVVDRDQIAQGQQGRDRQKATDEQAVKVRQTVANDATDELNITTDASINQRQTGLQKSNAEPEDEWEQVPGTSQ